MPLKNYQARIIYLLTQQELKIAEIYRFFSGLFPAMREFWDALAQEKMEQATWIEYLYRKAQADIVQFQDGKIKTYTVESFLKYLDENLTKIKMKAPTVQTAFSLALGIEQSLLVRKVFDHFQTSDRETMAVILELQNKNKEHAERIEQAAATAAAATPKHG